mgnify:FL=1
MLYNFSHVEDLAALMRDFQEHQKVTEQSSKDLLKARTAFNNATEHHELCIDYQKLFSDMLHKLLNTKTEQEMMKIRLSYQPKVHLLIQKMDALEKKMEGVVSPAALESRRTVDENMNKIDQLVSAAKQLKEMMPATPSLALVPEPVI